jgi:hypothetical protein
MLPVSRRGGRRVLRKRTTSEEGRRRDLTETGKGKGKGKGEATAKSIYEVWAHSSLHPGPR